MAIIGSDFHGDFNKVTKFLEYKPDEQHIFAGDILDSFTKSPEEQLKCLNTLINSSCELIWGNHEQNYRKERKPCSGFKWQWYDTFCKILEDNKDRFKNAILVDDYIVTHAGIGEEFELFDDPQTQVDDLNIGGMDVYTVGYSRGGFAPQGGIFWFDHLRDGKLSDKYNQVFGHTASEEPVEYRGQSSLGGNYHHVCINTRDTSEDVYIFDTKHREIVKL
jgi:hypothetical protein